MPRSVSLPAMQAAMAQETGKVFLALVEVTHALLPSPVRLVANTQDITSNGNLYTAFPFSVRFPDDQEDKEPSAELVVSNVDQALIAELRKWHEPPSVVLSVILSDSPNVIEWGPLKMEPKGVRYDANEIRFELGLQAFSQEPFPWRTFDVVNFPGMFK